MGLFDHFPYTNFHELNLDWILQMLQKIDKTMDEFVAINALKYADPIQWDITSQYEKNTIVIDPQSGTAYISTQPVPVGVALTNTDYWNVVFDLEQFVTKANGNFTPRVEEQTTTTATFATPEGNLLIWGGDLYVALVNITAGDQYVVDSNIKRITIEDIIGRLIDLNTSDKSNIVAAINEVLSGLNTIITNVGDLATLTTTDQSSIVNAINELVSNIGDLTSLLTVDKSSLVNAVNELVSNMGDLSNLITTDKSSLVNAINEAASRESFKVATTAQTVIYLDDANGSDDNDGLTASTAFKTLDKAISCLNSISSALRIEFLSTGTYDCSYDVISGCFLHFRAEAPNIVVNFPAGKDITFYDSDFLVLDTPSIAGNNFIFNGYRILTVNAHFEMYDTEFNIGFHLEGTNGQFTRCQFNKNCLFTDSYGLVVNCTMNTDFSLGYQFTAQHHSSLEFRGTLSYGNDYNQTYYCCYVTDSQVICTCDFSGETAPHTFRLERSKLISAMVNMPTYNMVGPNDVITNPTIGSTHEAGLSNITPYYDGVNRIGMGIYFFHANFTATTTVSTQKVATLAIHPVLASYIPIASGSGDDGYVEINTSGEVIVHNITSTGSKHVQGLIRILNIDNT